MNKIGMIVKCIAGVYDVFSEEKIYQAKAAGRFRNEKITPLVGDNVEFTLSDDGEECCITEILPRKNELLRPPIANATTLILTLASKKPNPDFKLIDTMINYCRILDIEPIVCINKTDYDAKSAFEIGEQYSKSNIKVYLTSFEDRHTLDDLKQSLKEGITCFSGQSAVGKSTIMNYLLGRELFETGGLSKKTDRGKHTTRHIELVELKKNCFLADTPGFSLIETPSIDPAELKNLYFEFEPFSESCRFNGCNHINEPDCAVKNAVVNGILSRERHERYIEIYNEINEKWRRRYD